MPLLLVVRGWGKVTLIVVGVWWGILVWVVCRTRLGAGGGGKGVVLMVVLGGGVYFHFLSRLTLMGLAHVLRFCARRNLVNISSVALRHYCQDGNLNGGCLKLV